MRKRTLLLFLSVFCISMLTYGVDGWIRINQLGYLPKSQKKAILISESTQLIKDFGIYDALTNEELGKFNTVIDRGEFGLYQSTYVLDFTAFQLQGAFYIKAGPIFSPTIYINKNVYVGTADFLLNYIRQQRWGINPALDGLANRETDYEYNDKSINPVEATPKSFDRGTFSSNRESRIAKKNIYSDFRQLKPVDVKGGWHNAADFDQYGATAANAVYQMLFAYRLNPNSFADNYDATGKEGANGIPDILDEAKWGLSWLLKMYPAKNTLYHQISDKINGQTSVDDDNRNNQTAGLGRPVFPATGKPQGPGAIKNKSNGIASIAGKYASAFALGAELLLNHYPTFADTLETVAIDAYEYGKKNPGVCQTVPSTSPNNYTEENWSDDMELAAAQLYRLTYEGSYLKEAAEYGHLEPITPWMCSDTARHYQWYPFINLGHYMISDLENPRYKKEYLQNMLNGIQRMSLRAAENPFDVGVPMIWDSNNLVTALATQCRLYRGITNDSTYLNMENALVDWLFGRNPWGISMVLGLPKYGITPTNPHSTLWYNRIPISGGLVGGPVAKAVFKSRRINLSKADNYDRYQSDWAVYHDDFTDYVTNEPTLDGTAALTYLLANKQQEANPEKTADKNQYSYGGITRTDPDKKQISLVFCGHENADGYKTIRQTLKKLNIKASFFFTGDFYRNPDFAKIIKGLQQDHHYLGANSDKNLIYCSWRNRDSISIDRDEFIQDIKNNYAEMAKFGINKNQTPFFLPPYELYNDSVSQWCKEIGLNLISPTPGTLSSNDNTTPEMRDNYYSSGEIFNRILQVGTNNGFNGGILLFHLGSDKQRLDKFHPRLYSLLIELSKAGYDFVDLYQATDILDKNIIIPKDKKQKRKN